MITIHKSLKTLSTHNNKVTFCNEGPKSFQFIVHIPKVTIQEIDASIGEIHMYKKPTINNFVYNVKDRTEIIHSQYFLVEENKFIKFYTFEWFTNKKDCLKKKITEVNRFEKKTKMWKSSRFKIKKFKNFHGCELVFWNINTYGEIDSRGNKQPSGVLYDIFKDLKEKFNFKMKIDNESILNTSDKKFMPRFKPCQMFLRNVCLPRSFSQFVIAKNHMSHPYFSASELIAVPPGQEYSGYEKLLLPFDKLTWLLIIFTFLATYFVIFITKFTSVKVRNLICGENVENPSLNVAAHFFGLGQLTLPRRSFPRFLLMSFIIFSLIIRTCWQGIIFEFMNKEMRKPEIRSIEEGINKNFKFYIDHCSKKDNCTSERGGKLWMCDKTCGIDER
jgi:hypothetical protein